MQVGTFLKPCTVNELKGTDDCYSTNSSSSPKSANFTYRVILSLEAPNSIRQEIQAVNVDTLGKVLQNLEKRISSVLGCERRPVSASIMSRFCFASFLVCVYKFSSHYLNNIIFYRK